MQGKKAHFGLAKGSGGTDKHSNNGIDPSIPSHSRRIMTRNAVGEVELSDSLSNLSMSKLNVANFQLAIYIAMAHAGLGLAILILYGVGLLLKDYWKPIQWAVLISMPLREVQGVVVQFWEQPLQMGLWETLMAIPYATLHAFLDTALDAHGALLEIAGGGGVFPSRVGFGKLFQWLLSFAICTLGNEFLGPAALTVIMLVGYSVYAAMTTVLPVVTAAFPVRSPRAGDRRSSAATLLAWTIQPLGRATRIALTIAVKAFRWSNRGVTQSLIPTLPAVVAIFLISMMIIGSLGGLVLFSYKVGVEGKDAVVTFKTHAQSNNYAESVGLSQWLEENNIPQYIDMHMMKAYDKLVQRVDAVAAKNNMSDLATLGKEFLRGISHKGTVIGSREEAESREKAASSYPLLEYLQTLKARLRGYDFSRVGETVLVGSTNLMTGSIYILLFLGADSTRRRCATMLDHAVSSVLLTTTKTAFFQASFTYLLFRFFRIHFLYMSTLIAIMQAVIPLFPKWVALLPAVAQLALEMRYVQGVVLIITHVYVMGYGVKKIHGEMTRHNEYLTGLSIAGGMTLFSPAEGPIMGPLLMTLLLATKNLYTEFVLTKLP